MPLWESAQFCPFVTLHRIAIFQGRLCNRRHHWRRYEESYDGFSAVSKHLPILEYRDTQREGRMRLDEAALVLVSARVLTSFSFLWRYLRTHVFLSFSNIVHSFTNGICATVLQCCTVQLRTNKSV